MKTTKEIIKTTFQETLANFTFPLLIGCSLLAVLGFNLIGQGQAVLDELCYLLTC